MLRQVVRDDSSLLPGPSGRQQPPLALRANRETNTFNGAVSRVQALKTCRNFKTARHTVVQAAEQVNATEPRWASSDVIDALKYNSDGLVAVVVQHVDTGDVLMQAFANKDALLETLDTGLATFYSRSRKGRWCKGETSGHFIKVHQVYVDCDKDSIIYLGDPIGPACHTGAPTCWFSEITVDGDNIQQVEDNSSSKHRPLTTLYALERTIQQRKEEPQPEGGKPSWTARLLSNPELLCKKVREEAGELCQALEQEEGRERVASEMADLLYHSMVLLAREGVPMEEVLRVLRARFGTSGIEERANRGK